MFPPAGPSGPPVRRKVLDPAAVTALPDLGGLIDREATDAGISPDLLRRVIQTESAGRPDAVSPKGAIGLGQLMPGTAKDLGVNPHHPVENVRGAARYLRQQLDTFGGDEARALAAYNAGPGAVRKAGGVPTYPETQAYVRKIQGTAGTPPPTAPTRRKILDPAAVTALPPTTPAPTPYQPGSHPLARLGAGVLAFARDPMTTLEAGATNVAQGLRDTVLPYLNSGEAVRSTARVALPTAGAIGGSVLGARGGPEGALVGATLGSSVGELGAMGVETLTGAPPTMEEALQRYYGAARTGAVGELTGAGLATAAGKILRPFAGKVTSVGREALSKYGFQFTPAQVTDSRALDIAENIASGSMFGGGRYHKFLESQQHLFDAERARLIDRFGGFRDPEAVGGIIQASRQAGIDRFQQQAAQKYADAAMLAEGVQIPMDDLVGFAQGELAKRTALPGEVTGDSGLRLLRQVAEAGGDEAAAVPQIGTGARAAMAGRPEYADLATLLGQMESGTMATSLSFDQASFFRSELLRLVREREDAPGGQSDRLVGVAKQLVKRLEGAIDAHLPEGAKLAWREANAFYKAGKQRFDTEFLRKLGQKDPERVVDFIVKGGATTQVRAAREAVSPQAWKAVQAKTVERILTSPKNETLTASGAEAGKALSTLTRPTLREIFPDADHGEVEQMARILDEVQRKKEGTGKVWIQLTQAGAVANIPAGGKVGAVARATLVAPWLISRLFTSTAGRQWLTTGFGSPAGSPQFTKAVSEASLFLAREATRQAQGGAYSEAWRDGGDTPSASPGGPPSAPEPRRKPVAGPPPSPPR